MKTLFIDKEFLYDGTQLTSLFAYKNYGVLGNSIVSWVGECSVSFEHMVDYEDFRAKEKICGDKMLHFIVELFDKDLTHAVLLQRLFAATAHYEIQQSILSSQFKRVGDDLYFKEGKLSISIASSSPVSQMIHFALNVTNEGTPVKTSSLQDLNIGPKEISKKLMETVSKEYQSIVEATQKVKPLN